MTMTRRTRLFSPPRKRHLSRPPPPPALLLPLLLLASFALARAGDRVVVVGRYATRPHGRGPEDGRPAPPFRPRNPLSPPRPPLLLLRGGDGGGVGDAPRKKIELVIGVDGGTESIRACCFDARTGAVVGSARAVPYATSHPAAGWAEQSPEDWYRNLGAATRGALSTLEDGDGVEYDVKALCCDTTCCSVVALSRSFAPLRPCLLWMDARSASQAAKIMDVARASAVESSRSILEAFPELRVNSRGEGPISAEWLLPKAMWIKEQEPEVWEEAEVICEYQDYINYKLTGRMVASSCNAAVRWHHDGWEVLQRGDEEGDDEMHRGRPMKLYKVLGMEDLAEKLPKETLAMGEVVGGLTEEAAVDLGLPVGTKVVQVSSFAIEWPNDRSCLFDLPCKLWTPGCLAHVHES